MIPFTTEHWGMSLLFVNNDDYSGRILIIKENEKTPYLYFKKRHSTLFFLQGAVILVVEGQKKIVQEGDTVIIPPKIMYSLAAIKSDATIIDTGTGFDVNDIVIVEE